MPSIAETAARKEAARVCSLPAGFLGRLFDEEAMDLAIRYPANSALAWETAVRQKPRLFGLFGRVVAFAVEATFEGPVVNGVPRLYRIRNGCPKEATPKDRRTLRGLQDCWSDTLLHNMNRVAGPDVRDPMMNTIRKMWAVRMLAIGALGRSFEASLMGDTQNASTQAIRLALSVNNFAGLGVANGVRKLTPHQALERSSSPLYRTAGLRVEQLEEFAYQYLGEREDGPRYTFTLRPRAIRSDMYRSLGNGTAAFTHPIDELPSEAFGTIGEVPTEMPGELIGCPLLLTQGLTPMFWRGVVNSLAEAGLVR